VKRLEDERALYGNDTELRPRERRAKFGVVRWRVAVAGQRPPEAFEPLHALASFHGAVVKFGMPLGIFGVAHALLPRERGRSTCFALYGWAVSIGVRTHAVTFLELSRLAQVLDNVLHDAEWR